MSPRVFISAIVFLLVVSTCRAWSQTQLVLGPANANPPIGRLTVSPGSNRGMSPSYRIERSYPGAETPITLVSAAGPLQFIETGKSVLLHKADGPLYVVTLGERISKLRDFSDAPTQTTGYSGAPERMNKLCEASVSKIVRWSDHPTADFLNTPEICYLEFVLLDTGAGLQVIAEHRSGGYLFLPALTQSSFSVLINGKLLDVGSISSSGLQLPDQTISISARRIPNGLRARSSHREDEATLILRHSYPEATYNWDNGIEVSAAKFYDNSTLRGLLASASTQLSSLNPFSNTALINATGTLQGITRDTSYLSAQLTNAGTPQIQTTNPASSQQTTTYNCPAGYTPTTLGTSPVCTATTSGTPTTATVTTSGVAPGTTNGTTTTQSATQVVPPSAPTSTALAAPTNLAVSGVDLLAEQFQLSNQISIYRALLVGADSDQYLLSSEQLTGVRDQTTVGFTVAIDPPRPYKHAAAEVRVIVVPPTGQDPVSVVNLLPSEKTYNVARITSRQESFGAGVSMEPINVGVNTGRSKDRLFLAREADTLAMFWGSEALRGSFVPRQYRDEDWWRSRTDRRGAYCPDPYKVRDGVVDGSVTFGWQFRPVLGEDYVRGGQRQVFAQIALPAGQDEVYEPTVYIQTLWRDYDSKRKVLGAVFLNSCTRVEQPGGLAMHAPLVTRKMGITDIGGGKIRLRAEGDFFSSGMFVRSGDSTILPTRFDGTAIEVIGNAHDLIAAGDLTLVAANSRRTPFSVERKRDDPDPAAPIADFSAVALPQPDGNSTVEVDVVLSPKYRPSPDGDGLPEFPLIATGSAVYGLQSSPFDNKTCEATGTPSQEHCHYTFTTGTSTLRANKEVTLVDFTRQDFRKAKNVVFGPSFDSIALETPQKSDPKTGKPSKGKSTYIVSGHDLGKAAFNKPATNGQQAPGTSRVRLFSESQDLLDPQKPQTPASVEVLADDAIRLTVDLRNLRDPKQIAFLVEPANPLAGALALPARWPMKLPTGDPKPSTLDVTPKSVSVGDAGLTITLKADDLFQLTKVSLENTDYPVKVAGNGKSATFTLPMDVTKTAGHKEFATGLSGSLATFQIEVKNKGK